MTNMYRLVTSHLPQHQLPVNFMDHIFIPLCFVVASFLFIIITFPLTLISVKDAKQRKTGTRPKACLQRHCSRIFAPLSAIVTQLPSLVSITMVATWRRNRIVCMQGGWLKVTVERWVAVLTHITPCCYFLAQYGNISRE